jgi:hypothetical protein
MNLTYVNFWEYLRWITITDLILKSHRLPKRQPLVELAMMDEQNLSLVNDKNRDGEINFSWMWAIGNYDFVASTS